MAHRSLAATDRGSGYVLPSRFMALVLLILCFLPFVWSVPCPSFGSTENQPTAETSPPLVPAHALHRFGSLALRQGEVIYSLAFSPDGKTVTAASDAGQVRTWDVQTGRELCRFKGHRSLVSAVVFSPDGRTLAAGGADREVRLWCLATGEELQHVSTQQDVTCLAFSPDGKLFASGAKDDTVRLWETATGKEARTFSGFQYGKLALLAFSADGTTLMSSDRRETVSWDVATGKKLTVIDHSSHPPATLAFSPVTKTLVCSFRDGSIALCDSATGKELRRLQDEDREIADVVLSPDGKRLAWWAGPRFQTQVRICDLAPGGESWALPEQEPGVYCAAFSPDGNLLATGGWEGVIRIWDLRTRKELPPPRATPVLSSVLTSLPTAKRLPPAARTAPPGSGTCPADEKRIAGACTCTIASRYASRRMAACWR
jgi:WD40 repeat protein